MGPDGAKGDRGELGMTVSAKPYQRAQSEDADNKQQDMYNVLI